MPRLEQLSRLAPGIVAFADWTDWAHNRGLSDTLGKSRFFATLGQAVAAYRAEVIEHANLLR